jgi:TolB-like protein
MLATFPAQSADNAQDIIVSPKCTSELVQKMGEKIAADPDRTFVKSVAILDFDLIPECQSRKIDAAVAKNVREDLSTAMGEVKGIKLVERGQMSAALASLKLDASGIISFETAKKLGKMLSADYVLCGSISDRGVFVVINARMIDTQTGEVKYPMSVDFNK